MKSRISDFPVSEKPVNSPHTLEYIRERFSGLIETGYIDAFNEGGLMIVVYCLANEINELKEQVKELKEQLNKQP